MTRSKGLICNFAVETVHIAMFLVLTDYVSIDIADKKSTTRVVNVNRLAHLANGFDNGAN